MRVWSLTNLGAFIYIGEVIVGFVVSKSSHNVKIRAED